MAKKKLTEGKLDKIPGLETSKDPAPDSDKKMASYFLSKTSIDFIERMKYWERLKTNALAIDELIRVYKIHTKKDFEPIP